MTLGGDDAQAADRLNKLMVFGPGFAQLSGFDRFVAFALALVLHQCVDGFFHVTAQHNVGAATGHVGGNGDGLGRTGLRDDVSFAGVLLGVEHLVLQTRLVQHA